jgi:hypothetical protein
MLSDLNASRRREARVMPEPPATETAIAPARPGLASERHTERIVADFPGVAESGGRAIVMAHRRLARPGLAERAGRRRTWHVRIEAREA